MLILVGCVEVAIFAVAVRAQRHGNDLFAAALILLMVYVAVMSGLVG